LAAALPDKQRVAVVERLSALVDESESMLDSGSEDSAAFTTSALKFHFGIVAESGNTTIGLLAGALTAVWNAQESSWAERATTDGAYPDPKHRRDVVKVHRRVIKYIAEGNIDRVTQALRAHLAETQSYVNYKNAQVEVLDSFR